MAGVSIDGGGSGGKKTLDAEIPLIPFIDLLLCCVMFLLVTAVWNQLARLNANQQQSADSVHQDDPSTPAVKLILRVQSGGFVLASTAGEQTAIPKSGDGFDLEALRTQLQGRRHLEPHRREIVVAPEDGVVYRDIVQAMDVVVGEGYVDMSLQDGSSLL